VLHEFAKVDDGIGTGSPTRMRAVTSFGFNVKVYRLGILYCTTIESSMLVLRVYEVRPHGRTDERTEMVDSS